MDRIETASGRLLTRAVRTIEPDAVFATLAREGAASVWWDPSERDECFIGFAASPDDMLVVEHADEVDVDAFARVLRARLTGAAPSALLGWWGCLSYEFGVRAAGLPVADDDVPLASFAFVDRGLVFATGEVTLIVLEGAPGAEEWLDRVEARIAALPSAQQDPPPEAGAR